MAIVLVEALQDASHEDGFWFRLSSPSLQQVLRVISPLNDVVLDHHDFLEVCLLISNIVDKYSSFTQTHSTSVAHVAAKLAELYGCDRYTQIKSASRGTCTILASWVFHWKSSRSRESWSRTSTRK